jgi:hypothetical protein
VRVDTSQLAGGSFYDTWAHALTLAGSQPVQDAALVLDGGWSNPTGQVVNLSTATVDGDSFTMPTATSGVVDNSAPAWISVTKFNGATPIGPIDESTLTSTQGDVGGQFRQVDSMYMYNLPVNDLTDKTATYQVGVSFHSDGSSPVANTVTFGLK